jgi:hypothetical protein
MEVSGQMKKISKLKLALEAARAELAAKT